MEPEPKKRLPTFSAVLLFIFAAVSGFGGAAGVLQYLGITATDLDNWFVNSLSHALLLLLSIALLCSSVSIYTWLIKRLSINSARAQIDELKRHMGESAESLSKQIENLAGMHAGEVRLRQTLEQQAKELQAQRDALRLANNQLVDGLKQKQDEFYERDRRHRDTVRKFLGIPEGMATDGPCLWVQYKPDNTEPYPHLEKLVFSTDGESALRIREIKPLVWKVDLEFPITQCSALGVVRSEPIDCGFTVEDGGRLFGLPDLYRDMMNKCGPDAQPILDVVCEGMSGTQFLKRFILSIGSHDEIVMEPVRIDLGDGVMA